MPPNAGNLLCQFHLQIACDPMRSTIPQDALSPSAKRLHHCSISPTAWPFYSAKSHNCRSQSADIAVNIIRFTKAVKAFRCFKLQKNLASRYIPRPGGQNTELLIHEILDFDAHRHYSNNDIAVEK